MYSSLVNGMYYLLLLVLLCCVFFTIARICTTFQYQVVYYLPWVESVLSVAGGGVCITYFLQYCLCLAIWVELRAKNNRTNTFRDNHFYHILPILLLFVSTLDKYKYNSHYSLQIRYQKMRAACACTENTTKNMRRKQIWIILCSGNRFRPFFALMIMRHFFSPHNGVKVNIDSLLISDWLMRATPSEIWDGRGLDWALQACLSTIGVGLLSTIGRVYLL